MILKADINTCEIIDWHANTGEYNARILQVELCEEMSKCAMAFATFELADGTVYESPITDGKAEIPLFENPQFVKIGAYSADYEGDECKKRYSPTPCYNYINPGSYSSNGEEPPIPTPSDFEQLLEDFALKEDVANKSTDLEADRNSKEKYPNVADILKYIDEKSSRTINIIKEIDIDATFDDTEIYNANVFNGAFNELVSLYENLDERFSAIDDDYTQALELLGGC